MSSTFDTMQHALLWLEKRIDTASDKQAFDVIHYMKEIVDGLHDYDHGQIHGTGPGTAAGKSVTLLATAMKYEDDEDRKMWLDAKAKIFD